jgi:ATP-binding protein involved in chromosome partitioning
MTTCNHQSTDQLPDEQKIRARMSRITHKIAVFSGKGGVGKSTVAVNMAASLAMTGNKVGLLDTDIHGPSIPTMLGINGKRPVQLPDAILPFQAGNLCVMSMGLLIDSVESALIWRGPMKTGVIKQFLGDVDWGELDYLIIDSPPATGDEALAICQLIDKLSGAVIVTTPQKVAEDDVRKSISFCRKLEIPILGILENMNGIICPNCNETAYLFPIGAGQRMANDYHLPFLGSLPMDPDIALACDQGTPFVQHFSHTATARLMQEIMQPVTDRLKTKPTETNPEKSTMKIAVPTANNQLCMHFGHCEVFTLITVDPTTRELQQTQQLVPPPHEPGVLPHWLAQQGADLIIAGGMGQRAQALFEEQNIKVITGASGDLTPVEVINAYLHNTLQTGDNACDH